MLIQSTVWRQQIGKQKQTLLQSVQIISAIKIQITLRSYFGRRRQKKTQAAIKIQRTWRRKCFIWYALLRTIYQQPIPELHRSATIIQRAWRNWFIYKNNPLAHKYNKRLEGMCLNCSTALL